MKLPLLNLRRYCDAYGLSLFIARDNLRIAILPQYREPVDSDFHAPSHFASPLSDLPLSVRIAAGQYADSKH